MANDSIKYPVIRLSASNVKYPDNSDEAIIYFDPAMNSQISNIKSQKLIKYSSEYDVKKMMNSVTDYPNLFIVSDSIDLSLKALPISILNSPFSILNSICSSCL